jgi:hypothetical protein
VRCAVSRWTSVANLHCAAASKAVRAGGGRCAAGR